MEEEKKYVAGWIFWLFEILIIISIIAYGLNYAGLIGKTVVERKVFENSYQRSESLKSEIATYEAQLSEINRMLASNIDSQTRANFEAQASAIRILLNVSRSKQ